MDLRLDGDTALCTAASSGLGYASAAALAREGANVAICGYTPEHVERAERQLRELGDDAEVLAVEADITDPDELTAFVETTVDEFGGLDRVVTSAGGPPSGPFRGTDDRDWYQAYDMLVMSVVWTLRAARPHLIESGGSIVAITSRTVREVADGLVLSNSVRRGVIGLIKTVAREFGPEVRANAVLPGAHETGRIEELIEAAVERGEVPDYEAGYEDWAADVPLDRIGEPGELGDVVAFLASDRASFVNGTALPVDGGLTRS
ncbi:oxidoreductase [Halobacteriales archaeon QH_10_67_13]|nr:MAG: oxidoreductase [Halobacteriales archaeon QH_10_67_13]